MKREIEKGSSEKEQNGELKQMIRSSEKMLAALFDQ
jgi:hypothetical protein